jgi:uncharacterized membrane protein/mono/diheme cytochrome c family protein
MILLSLPDLVGRFHPVLVHLPIGILLLACFFQWLSLRPRFDMLQPAVPVMMFWGAVGAVVSCISGYMLSLTGDYDEVLVDRHQWMGIITALSAAILYVLYKFSLGEKIAKWISLGIIVLITITGHLGGSLTHGSGYLAEGLHSGNEGNYTRKPIPNIQEAVLYTDVVQPLLQAKCYGCHGPNKQKGKLRLDKQESILKGGKDGKIIEPGKADESKMIERLLLPAEDEDHMPPKEKPQLTQGEIALLHWWISSGPDFTKKVKDLQQTDKIKPILTSLQSGNAGEEAVITDVPSSSVSAADNNAIVQLKKAGIIVIPVARNSNYLSVSFVTAGAGADSLISLLEPIKKQLVWLNLGNARLTDAAMEKIDKLSGLTRLQLNNTGVTDKGLSKLQSLNQLQSLNLVGTKVTAAGVLQLRSLKKLKNLYLYQTGVVNADWQQLHKAFPAVQLDSGNYTVPTLPEDTTVVKLN